MNDNRHIQPARAWATYRRLIAYTRPYISRLIVGTVFGAVFGAGTYALLTSATKTLERVFDLSNLRVVLATAILLPVFALVRSFAQFLGEYLVEWVGQRVVMDLRIETFSRLQRFAVGFFTKSRTGELMSRTLNDTTMIERAVATVLGDLMKQPFAFLGSVVFVVSLDWRLAIGSLALFPICIIPIAVFGRRVRRHAREGQERLADLSSILQESVVGMRIVRAFGMEEYECRRFGVQCRRFFSRIVRVVRAKASIEPIIVVISVFGLLPVLFYAHWAKMPASHFIMFAVAMLTLYEPVKKLSKIHVHIQQASASADRVFELLDTPIGVTNAEGAVELKESVREIAFERVAFAYEDEPVLADISFKVRMGESVALVGSSGAGKSTLVNLIPRFYDVSAGRILLNGSDIRDFTLESLRARMAMVTQETFLFNDTVANNIAYGHGEASRGDIVEAARRANADGFISELPGGYDTNVSERGVRLSGGQRQRIAIARALLRNAPILILDEATSSLDAESEKQVQDALMELMRGRAVFVIAHRLSTIIRCDRILVLDKGRIVESGPHAELLAAGGVYKRLYDIQSCET